MRENCEGCRFAVPVYMGDGDELLTACVSSGGNASTSWRRWEVTGMKM